MNSTTTMRTRRNCRWMHVQKTVLVGFIATWFLAASPMRGSVSMKATYEGSDLSGACSPDERRTALLPKPAPGFGGSVLGAGVGCRSRAPVRWCPPV